jgi:hypothetical protein
MRQSTRRACSRIRKNSGRKLGKPKSDDFGYIRRSSWFISPRLLLAPLDDNDIA